VTARPPAASAGHQFPATTDERGFFPLAVGLKVAVTAEGPDPVRTLLLFGDPEAPVRVLTGDLDQGRVHVLAEPVDLDGDNQPHLTEEARP
jgi:hypothetical protein